MNDKSKTTLMYPISFVGPHHTWAALSWDMSNLGAHSFFATYKMERFILTDS